MTPIDLVDAEQRMSAGFQAGRRVDLAGGEVRASVIRWLLLGGQEPQPGHRPRLALRAARIVGRLDLRYADVGFQISLHECEFTDRPLFYGASLKHVRMRGSKLPGMDASHAVVGGNLRLSGCHFTGLLELTRVTIGGDLIANNGFFCQGEFRLNRADVGGAVRCHGARLSNPGGTALFAPDLKVGRSPTSAMACTPRAI